LTTLRSRFWDRFRELASDGRTLLITTQYVGEAAYCDYVAVLAEGEIVIIETPQGLRHAAYGGEQIEVTFVAPPSRSRVEQLNQVVGVEGKEPDWVDSRTAHLVVEDAGEASQAVMQWANENEVELERAEVFQPEFDDVFVSLVADREEPSNGS
jgi:ABC-2 type transport system ATP-binding protein